MNETLGWFSVCSSSLDLGEVILKMKARLHSLALIYFDAIYKGYLITTGDEKFFFPVEIMT